MSEVDERSKKRPSSLETMVTLPAKYVMSTIGVVLSISGFVALATAQPVKNWVKNHPYPIYLALIVAVLIIAGTLDYSYNLRKRIRSPSHHDKKFYSAALEQLPPNGAVIAWLKGAEITGATTRDFPADVLDALEKTTGFSRTQPVGFDDTRMAGSFESLTEAITSFRHSVDRWTLAAHIRQFRPTAEPSPGVLRPETSQSPTSPRAAGPGLDEDAAALARHHHDLIRAYDDFIRTAHARGIDIDG